MRTTDFVDSYFDAWNCADPTAVARHFARDGYYYDIPENTRYTHDELARWLAVFFARHRHRYELLGEVLMGADTLAFQYRMIPGGRSRARTRRSYRGAEFVNLCDDGALVITDYYDAPGMTARLPAPRSAGARRHKYAKSGLDARQLGIYKARLEGVMRSQKAYLQADLTLPRLAERVGCSVNHLSQVVNAGYGTNFFDYLNLHRIAHARELLGRPDARGQAILDIAYAVGFNSNSAFYAAFRKYVGRTPARYRRDKLGKAQ